MLLAGFFCTSVCFAQITSSYPDDFIQKPTVSWTFKAQGGFFSSAIVDNGIIYIGSLDSNLYALQIKTGNLVWKFNAKGSIRSSVCLDGKSVYVVSGDGNLYCIDKSNGKEKWKFKTEGEQKYPLYSYADYFYSSPIEEGETIYFGSGDGNIYSVNSTNGLLNWKYKTNAVVHTTPLIHADKLYAGSFDGYFYALNKATGELAWKFKSVGQRFFPVGEFQGSPVYFNGTVYVGARDFNLYALDAEKGYCRWNKSFLGGWAVATAQFKDSIMYVGTADEMTLLSLQPESGALNWKAPVKFNVFGSCTFSKNMCYVATLMGKLFGIDQKTGKIVWVWNVEDYDRYRTKYFDGNDNYRVDIGNVIRKGDDFMTMYFDLGAIFGTPYIDDNNLIIASLDGNVYCLKQ